MRKASVAPPEIAERIQFPEWGKDAATVTGPQLKALQIAMDDSRPPESGLGITKNRDELVRCLQKIENYDVGASYAISDEGIILRCE